MKKIKDISWKIIKEWDIVNYYTCEPLQWYELVFRWVHKINKNFIDWKLELYQWPTISNMLFRPKWIALYFYQVICDIENASEELLEKVKWI